MCRGAAPDGKVVLAIVVLLTRCWSETARFVPGARRLADVMLREVLFQHGFTLPAARAENTFRDENFFRLHSAFAP
jgi:hypothetical protein